MAASGSSFSSGKTSPEKALQKLKHFCGYQERCQAEVRQKLYSLGLFKKEVEELISRLIEEEYLNEERYAMGFASGNHESWAGGNRRSVMNCARKESVNSASKKH